MLRPSRPRRGTTAVECAVIFPITFLLLLGLIVGALGVFRYQEVAALAREAARWAIVRGVQYETVTGRVAPSPADIYNTVILPKAVGLDPSRLAYNITWSPDKRPGSTITVQLTYRWLPEVFLGGMDLRSTSTMIMSY